ARGMAERIVDRLEAVEVEEEHGAAMLAPNSAHQRIVERAAKGLAIGQPGQRVLTRKAIELDFRLAHLGEVGGEPAETEESADLVMLRSARKRPPYVVLGLGADDQVLECDVGGRIEIERPLRG